MWSAAILEPSTSFSREAPQFILQWFVKEDSLELCRLIDPDVYQPLTKITTGKWGPAIFHKIYSGASQCFVWFDFWSLIWAMCKESGVDHPSSHWWPSPNDLLTWARQESSLAFAPNSLSSLFLSWWAMAIWIPKLISRRKWIYGIHS